MSATAKLLFSFTLLFSLHTPSQGMTSTQDALTLIQAEEQKQKSEIINSLTDTSYSGNTIPLYVQGETKIWCIPLDTAYKIASRNDQGEVSSSNESGNHPVSEHKGFYYKSSLRNIPNRPAFDLSAYYFQKLLVGQGVIPSTLICLGKVRGYFRTERSSPPQQDWCFVQVSPGVKGETLHTFLKKYPDPLVFLEKLDSKSISAQILTSFITCIEDGKSDNFILVKRDGKLFIVNIDNDQVFTHHFRYEKSAWKGSGLKIRYKNIFLLFDQLIAKPVDQEIAKRIIETPVESLIINWLAATWNATVDYHTPAYPIGQNTKKVLQREGCDFRLSSLTLKRIITKLECLQYFLKQAQIRGQLHTVTHDEIFRYMYPLVRECYHKLGLMAGTDTKSGKILHAMKLLYASPKKLGDYIDLSMELPEGKNSPAKARTRDEAGEH